MPTFVNWPGRTLKPTCGDGAHRTDRGDNRRWTNLRNCELLLMLVSCGSWRVRRCISVAVLLCLRARCFALLFFERQPGIQLVSRLMRDGSPILEQLSSSPQCHGSASLHTMSFSNLSPFQCLHRTPACVFTTHSLQDVPEIFWQLNGFNLTHAKRKILRRNPEEPDGSRHKSLKSFTLTIPQNSAKLVKISPGIIARRHHTDQRLMVLLKEQCAE